MSLKRLACSLGTPSPLMVWQTSGAEQGLTGILLSRSILGANSEVLAISWGPKAQAQAPAGSGNLLEVHQEAAKRCSQLVAFRPFTSCAGVK